MTDQTVEERAREVFGRWLWLLPREIPRTDAGTHVDHVLCHLTAAGIALVDAAELEALREFADARFIDGPVCADESAERCHASRDATRPFVLARRKAVTDD